VSADVRAPGDSRRGDGRDADSVSAVADGDRIVVVGWSRRGTWSGDARRRARPRASRSPSSNAVVAREPTAP